MIANVGCKGGGEVPTNISGWEKRLTTITRLIHSKVVLLITDFTTAVDLDYKNAHYLPFSPSHRFCFRAAV